MKHNPGRKERRDNFYHKSYDEKKKRNVQVGHGQSNQIHAMGVLKPVVELQSHQLTNKRCEMIKKHPERKLASEII